MGGTRITVKNLQGGQRRRRASNVILVSRRGARARTGTYVAIKRAKKG